MNYEGGENGTTWVYAYDRGGNVLSKTRYAYTTGALGTAQKNIAYSYDSVWKDKLTQYGSKVIQSDAQGNVTHDSHWAYSWENGRRLKSMSTISQTMTFSYDENGQRIRKSYAGVTTDYTVQGERIVHVKSSDSTLGEMHIYYDGDRPDMVLYDGATYRYVHSLQGDILGLQDSTGEMVVVYRYDPWGRPVWLSGSMSETLGALNPFRYRGYVYDTESGLYYLRSRYYNPNWGRFLSADDTALLGTVNALFADNLFTYCRNNPVMGYDPTGYWDWWLFSKVLLTTVIVSAGLIGVGALAAASVATASVLLPVAGVAAKTFVASTVAMAGTHVVFGAINGASCAQISGGEWYDGAMAGAIGGTVTSVASYTSSRYTCPDAVLRLNTNARVLGSLVYDVSYDYFCTGTIKSSSTPMYIADVVMDASYSVVYNDYLTGPIVDCLDYTVDTFQTYAYYVK